jgi:phosphoenolpyruvate synthase/pyruvate phosphate dikinase
MDRYVLGLEEVDHNQVELVGGKAAHLGELVRIGGLRVPAGFCVTTAAFRRVLADVPSIDDRLDQLSHLDAQDHDAIGASSTALRAAVQAIAIPDELTAAVTDWLQRLGEHLGYAVRSSATAEDSPTASFAGQQDTYLNVVGSAAILEHIRQCWASLFTARAVAYRLRNGYDHRKVHMAVVVQRMVVPQASGILFTADPVSSNRKVATVEACFGLGDALVSGRVNPDAYQVRDGEILARAIASKQFAIEASPGGGTEERAIQPTRQQQPAILDAQVVRLVQLGRRTEAHFGRPQDIEWCLVDDEFHIVQSRPITTLFPIPAADDGANHVYVSVGHQQMMTDAMKPLGLSMFQLTALPPMHEAGGRLFVDVTERLAAPATRNVLVEVLGRSDPLIRNALRSILDRGDFIELLPDVAEAEDPSGGTAMPASAGAGPPLIAADPAIVTELIERTESSLAALKRSIATLSGPALLDFIRADIQELKRLLVDPRSHQVIMAAMEATWWLNDQLQEWIGEKNVADTLTQSVPHNVTSEMGLALLDLADAIRPYPEVLECLQHADDDAFPDRLDELSGGPHARDAICAFLDRYGMRCAGEIDITRPRWRERPSTLLPIILGNIKNFEPGAAARRFELGRQEASRKEQEVLERVRALPDGTAKAEEVTRMIDRVRTFSGYREFPKYGIVSRYDVYKRALLEEAERLVRHGVLREIDDIFFLTYQELEGVVRSHDVDEQLLRQRRAAFRSNEALTPPRVLTSDGEVIAGAYRRDDVPAGALVGLAVSTGTIEGRARVVLDLAKADVEPGDILVTTFTDPSWTPLFLTIAGLVTEVGGLMTHGSVIAREYGLPAIVGVQHATRLIADGQRIRVHGRDGYVEILSSDDAPPELRFTAEDAS